MVGWVLDREAPGIVAVELAFLPHAREDVGVRFGALVAAELLLFFEVGFVRVEAFFVGPLVADVAAVLPAEAPDVVQLWACIDLS